VAIGRAIVRKPNVFLFDEPLSNLDASLRVQMRIEITKLHRELKTTMIYVTHDQVEAMTLADRIVVLSAGSVEQVGSPLDLYHHPCNLFVAGFIGSPKMNFIDGKLCGIGEGTATVKLADGSEVLVCADASAAQIGSKVTLGIRPEHFDFGDAPDNRVKGRVLAAEHLGEATILYLEVEGAKENSLVRADADQAAKAGDEMLVRLPPGRCYLFNDAGLAFRRVKAA